MTDEAQPVRTITQPDLKLVRDPKHEWAAEQRFATDWIKAVAPQFGYDPDRLVRGQVFTTILGDDINCIAALEQFLKAGKERNFAKFAPPRRVELIDRLDWEISSLTETDREMRERLEKVRGVIEKSDWADKVSFQTATQAWQTDIFDWTKKHTAENPALQESVSYFRDLWFGNTEFRNAFTEFRNRSTR